MVIEKVNEVVTTDEIINMKDVLKVIVKEKDFAMIKDNIEITRDFALKLFKLGKLSYDAEIQQVEHDGDFMVMMIKATVSKNGQKAVGFGACSTEETAQKKSGARGIHDALATAETRAYKRALEMIVGLPFINEVILQIFGTYQNKKAELIKSEEYLALEAQMLRDISNEHFTGDITIDSQPVNLDDARLVANDFLANEVHTITKLTKGADKIARMLLVAEERDAVTEAPGSEGELDDGEINPDDVQEVFQGTLIDTPEKEGNLHE